MVCWLFTYLDSILVDSSLSWLILGGNGGGRKFRSSRLNCTNCERSFNDWFVELLFELFSSVVLTFLWLDELDEEEVDDDLEWLLCWTTGEIDVDDDIDELLLLNDDDFLGKTSGVCVERGTGVCCSSLWILWLLLSSNVDDETVTLFSVPPAERKSDNCAGVSFSFCKEFWTEKKMNEFVFISRWSIV